MKKKVWKILLVVIFLFFLLEIKYRHFRFPPPPPIKLYILYIPEVSTSQHGYLLQQKSCLLFGPFHTHAHTQMYRQTHTFLKMGEVMAAPVVCGWKDSNYTTTGPLADPSKTMIIMSVSAASSSSLATGQWPTSKLYIASFLEPRVTEAKDGEISVSCRPKCAYTQGEKHGWSGYAWPQMMQAFPNCTASLVCGLARRNLAQLWSKPSWH